MSVLELLFNILGPVIGIVSLGALTGQPLSVDTTSLSRLSYWVFGPAFIFDVLTEASLAGETIFRLVIAGLAGMISAAVITALTLKVLKKSYETIAVSSLTAAYGNVGNAGLAISVFAVGEHSLAIAGVFLLAINTTGMMFGVALAHGRSGSLLKALSLSLIAPMTIASALAIVINSFDLFVPALIRRSSGLLAGALIPVMLYTLGMQLRSSEKLSFTTPIGVATSAKLVIAPAVATAVAWWLGLRDDYLTVTAIQSAMPPAVFCVVLALEHDLEPKAVTATVTLATLVSVVTLPFVILFT